MRIISGSFRGRKLEAPSNKDVRPTTGKMRERVFSMLQHNRYPDLNGAHILDIFSGTGALGLEALSRGAAFVTFVEKSPSSLSILKKNIALLQADKDTDIIRGRSTSLPQSTKPCDFIFMDPPYGKNLIKPTIDRILEQGWLSEQGIIICEMHKDDNPDIPDPLEIIDERKQGIQRVLILKHK